MRDFWAYIGIGAIICILTAPVAFLINAVFLGGTTEGLCLIYQMITIITIVVCTGLILKKLNENNKDKKS